MHEKHLQRAGICSLDERPAVWWRLAKRKRQLLAMIRGWGRWYPVEDVTIEGWLVFPGTKELVR